MRGFHVLGDLGHGAGLISSHGRPGRGQRSRRGRRSESAGLAGPGADSDRAARRPRGGGRARGRPCVVQWSAGGSMHGPGLAEASASAERCRVLQRFVLSLCMRCTRIHSGPALTRSTVEALPVAAPPSESCYAMHPHRRKLGTWLASSCSYLKDRCLGPSRDRHGLLCMDTAVHLHQDDSEGAAHCSLQVRQAPAQRPGIHRHGQRPGGPGTDSDSEVSRGAAGGCKRQPGPGRAHQWSRGSR
jgi:hypothetical protein